MALRVSWCVFRVMIGIISYSNSQRVTRTSQPLFLTPLHNYKLQNLLMARLLVEEGLALFDPVQDIRGLPVGADIALHGFGGDASTDDNL